jgi:hypothetical protein
MSILELMGRELGVPLKQLEETTRRAAHLYKTYAIKKRSGDDHRLISHPAPALKLLQRWLAVRVLARLPIHECVFSYREGVGIRRHAELHKTNNYLLRIDLKDFFPSITAVDVIRLLMANRDAIEPRLSGDDMKTIARIVCKGRALTIGAPSSPVISNAVLYQFDGYWAPQATARGVVYTRYADDLYFSTNTPGLLTQFNQEVRQSLAALPWPKLNVNESKTTFTSRKRRRIVTGLSLTADRKVSLGRANKRYVRSLVHKIVTGKATPDQISYVKGYLSFAKSVEPSFLAALSRKFGDEALRAIDRLSNTPRKEGAQIRLV